ncbi:MAG: four helix bundle protein [Thermodesulfobacteriota bacterium]
MPTVRRFEDLECWQEARKLVKLIYAFTKQHGFEKDCALRDQIQRSAISIMSNIAEGFHRKSNKDFMKFLDYSRSSIAETLSHCFVALDQNYIDNTEMQRARQHLEVCWKKINSFIAYLNKCNR